MQKDLPIRNDREVKYTYELQSVNFDADFSMLHSTKGKCLFEGWLSTGQRSGGGVTEGKEG